MKSRNNAPARTTAVETALETLSDADLLRLRRFAQLRVRLAPSMDWRDLFQEAVARILDGRRKWPADVKFIVFMMQTIRSIANEHWRREQRAPGFAEFDDEQSFNEALESADQPERLVIRWTLLEDIHRIFANDPEVLAVLHGLEAEESPQEIQSQSGMSTTQYASAQKRIRRGISRAFPEGGVVT